MFLLFGLEPILLFFYSTFLLVDADHVLRTRHVHAKLVTHSAYARAQVDYLKDDRLSRLVVYLRVPLAPPSACPRAIIFCRFSERLRLRFYVLFLLLEGGAVLRRFAVHMMVFILVLLPDF